LGTIWDDNRIAGCPGYATTDLPTGALICGAFPFVTLGLWGAGVIIELNPYDPTLFKTGQMQARVIVQCDVMVVHPAAFVLSASVS
jgi:hypothetical protein